MASRGPRPVFSGSTRLSEWLFEGLYGGGTDGSQPDLVAKSGVSPAYISSILKKGRLPQNEKVVKIAKALKTDPDDGLFFLCLDRLDHEISDMPTSVQRRLKPIRDAVRTLTE